MRLNTEPAILRQLQETDSRIDSLSKQADALGRRERSLKLREALTKSLKAGEVVDGQMVDVQAQQKKLEDQVSILEQRLASDEKSLYDGSITNAKELKALQDDIATRSRHKDELETKLLQVMETAAEVGRKQSEIGALIARLEKEAELAGEDESKQTGELETRLAELKPQRAELAAGLSAATLERYEKLRSAKNGVAVGVYHDNICGSCGMGIPTAKVADVIGGEPPWTCPNCGRLLLPADERSTEE